MRILSLLALTSVLALTACSGESDSKPAEATASPEKGQEPPTAAPAIALGYVPPEERGRDSEGGAEVPAMPAERNRPAKRAWAPPPQASPTKRTWAPKLAENRPAGGGDGASPRTPRVFMPR